MSMILKEFLMGDYGDKIHLHSEMHKENRQDLSPPQKKSNSFSSITILYTRI